MDGSDFLSDGTLVLNERGEGYGQRVMWQLTLKECRN